MISSELTQRLIRDARNALYADLQATLGADVSDDALAACFMPEDVSDKLLHNLVQTAASNLQQSSYYKEVAVLGFASWSGNLPDEQVELFKSSVEQLCGRSAFMDTSPMPFCTDGVAVLGICLGAVQAEDTALEAATAKWLEGFVDKVSLMPAVDLWRKSLLWVAKAIVSRGDLGRLGTNDYVSSEVREGLVAVGVLPESVLSDEEQHEFLNAVLSSQAGLPLPLVVLRLCGLKWLYRSVPTVVPDNISVSDTCKFLREFTSAFHRWCWEAKPRSKKQGAEAIKWHVENEYHVQDLLYFMLRPIFPDLKDEEYFPSVGHKHPRTDLYIPSLRLIIEVKFVYQRTTFSKVIEELGADSALYLAEKSRYDTIVPFIWDDSRRGEEHALLIQGLLSIDGIADAIVVSRPGRMNDK